MITSKVINDLRKQEHDLIRDLNKSKYNDADSTKLESELKVLQDKIFCETYHIQKPEVRKMSDKTTTEAVVEEKTGVRQKRQQLATEIIEMLSAKGITDKDEKRKVFSTGYQMLK